MNTDLRPKNGWAAGLIRVSGNPNFRPTESGAYEPFTGAGAELFLRFRPLFLVGSRGSRGLIHS